MEQASTGVFICGWVGESEGGCGGSEVGLLSRLWVFETARVELVVTASRPVR